MNGRLAKKLRHIARKNDLVVALEFKAFVNRLGLMDRLKLAWRVLWRAL